MLIHELLNKYPDKIPKDDPLIILYTSSAVCMAKNGKDTNKKMYISRRVHYLRNGENFKLHNIDWCDGGMQLVDIATKNVGEHDLTLRIK